MKSKAKQNAKKQPRSKQGPKKKSKSVHLQVRPANRMQIRRIGLMEAEIASGSFPNAKSLGKQLGCSADAIRRCKEIMEMDRHIEYDKSKKGWYFDGPPTGKGLAVTRRELVAALFLMQGMEHLQGTCWEAAMESLCDKLAEGFEDIVTFRPSDWNKIMSSRSNGKTVVSPENLELLVNAIAEHETLHVTNYNQKGEVSERDLDPLHFELFEDNLYLIAHDHKNNKVLTFGAWRIDPIDQTGKTFERPADYNRDAYFAGSLGIYSEQDAIPRDIILGFSKKVAVMIQERRWNGQQKIEKMPDGTVNLHLNLKGLLEVSRMVLRWGPDVVDIDCDELLEMHGRNLEQMNANYAVMLEKAKARKQGAKVDKVNPSACKTGDVKPDQQTTNPTNPIIPASPERPSPLP